MIQIAICDDIPDQLEMILALVNEYIKSKNIDAQACAFSHPDDILKYCKTKNAHLYIFDVVMPMMSGIQLGQEIRVFDREAQIIYTSTAPEYALESFGANPLDYIIKPIDKNKLFSTLDLAIAKINAGEKTIIIKSRDGVHTVPIARVAYCEYNKHAVKYFLTNGEIIETSTIKGRFSEHVALILTDRRFIQPHAAFVVNMNRVERLSRDGFTMYGGVFVPISGKLFSEVKNTYINFRLKDEGRIQCQMC